MYRYTHVHTRAHHTCTRLATHVHTGADTGQGLRSHLEVAVCGEPQAVAGATEVVRHGGDEAHLAREAWHFIPLTCEWREGGTDSRLMRGSA